MTLVPAARAEPSAQLQVRQTEAQDDLRPRVLSVTSVADGHSATRVEFHLR